MIRRLDPAQQSWMGLAPTRKVMAALTEGGVPARFVGGAVRNALLGVAISDIDIATPLRPDAVIDRLKAAGIHAIPTGIDHGTVTAVSDHTPIEVTTLRRDVSTDGRRATVAFTEDWAEDAGRRDFTMNAIYADADGTLFDPTGGLADIAAHKVRFVGDPATRIREDYLRILRLFRFHAWYGAGAVDAEALAASAAEKAGLRRLSGERIQKEMLRLLEAPRAIDVLSVMQERGILTEIFPGGANVGRLARLKTVRDTNSADPILFLAALNPSAQACRTLALALRLSNADRDRLVGALSTDRALTASLSETAARRLLYRLGAEKFSDQVWLAWAEAPGDTGWKGLLDLAAGWAKPRFPLDGRDALAEGVPEGPAVGRALAALERWWVDEDFRPDRDALLRQLRQTIARPDR